MGPLVKTNLHNGNIGTQSESYLTANYWAPLSGKDDDDEDKVTHSTNEDIRTKATETLELPTVVQAKIDFRNRFHQSPMGGATMGHQPEACVTEHGY